jgi:hypothetical protein
MHPNRVWSTLALWEINFGLQWYMSVCHIHPTCVCVNQYTNQIARQSEFSWDNRIIVLLCHHFNDQHIIKDTKTKQKSK